MEPITKIIDWFKDLSKYLHPATFIPLICGFIPVVILLMSKVPSPQVSGWLLLVLAFFSCAFSVEMLCDSMDEAGRVNSGYPPRKFKKMRLRLMWTHQLQFCGFYRAIHNGVDLVIREGGTPVGLDSTACVENSLDEFGITSALDLIRSWHVRQRHRLPHTSMLVPCFVVFPKSPTGVLSGNDLKGSLQEMNGARIAVPGRSDITLLELELLAKKGKVELGKLQFCDATEYLKDPVKPIRDQETSFRLGYSMNEGVLGRLTNHAQWYYLHEMFNWPGDFYGDVLFTRLEIWQKWKLQCTELGKTVQKAFFDCCSDSDLTWQLVRKYNEPHYTMYSANHDKAGPDPFKEAMSVFSHCLGEGPQHDKLVGKYEEWQRLERLVTGGKETPYCDAIKTAGVFD